MECVSDLQDSCGIDILTRSIEIKSKDAVFLLDPKRLYVSEPIRISAYECSDISAYRLLQWESNQRQYAIVPFGELVARCAWYWALVDVSQSDACYYWYTYYRKELTTGEGNRISKSIGGIRVVVALMLLRYECEGIGRNFDLDTLVRFKIPDALNDCLVP